MEMEVAFAHVRMNIQFFGMTMNKAHFRLIMQFSSNLIQKNSNDTLVTCIKSYRSTFFFCHTRVSFESYVIRFQIILIYFL